MLNFRVALLSLVALAAVFAFPGLLQALTRNRAALELTHSISLHDVPAVWKMYCAAALPAASFADTGCGDSGTCYLAGTRANQSGAWQVGATLLATQTEPVGIFQRGYALWCQGETARAQEVWTPIAADAAERFRALGLSAYAQKEYALAQAWTELSMTLAPTARTHFSLGQMLSVRGFAARASDEFQMAMALEPNNAEYAVEAARLEMTRKNYARASALMERALTLAPNDWLRWHIYGNLLYQQNDWANAETAFYRSVMLNSTYSHSNAGVSFAMARQGKILQADAFIQNAIAYADTPVQSAGYAFSFANMASEAGEHALAVRLYERAVEITPANSVFVKAWLNEFVKQHDCAGLARASEKLGVMMRAQNLPLPPMPVCAP